MTELRSIDVKHDDCIAIISIREPFLDRGRETDDVVRSDLLLLLDGCSSPTVLIDLQGVASCPSGILGALIEFQKHLIRQGRQFGLLRPNDFLLEKLRTLKLADTVFLICSTQ